MLRKTTSVKVLPEIWKKAKKKAIDLDMDVSAYLEKLINEDTKKMTK